MARPVSQGGIDYPDGGFASGGQTYPVTLDIGELAARLGSINTYSRTGNVFWLDDFESGVAAWKTGGAGTGNEVLVSSLYPFNGSFSAKLIGGSTGGANAYIVKHFSLVKPGRVGVTARVYFGSAWESFWIEILYYDGADRIYPGIKVSDVNRAIYYTDENGTSVKIADIEDFTQYPGAYHTFKLVVDLENREYVRFLRDQHTYLLTDIPLYVTPAILAPRLSTTFTIYSRAGENDWCQVDGVVLTENETER